MTASVENVDAARARPLQPVLVRQPGATAVRAVALVLHGGREVSVAPVTAHQLAVLRMVPIARHLASAGEADGLGVWRLRFRYRGWNSDAHPVADVRWAVQQLREQHGDVPIVLVGHSMGGRAALWAADEPGVVGLVGLAPWVTPNEPYKQVVGRRLLVVHGTRDRTTSAKNSKALVDAVRDASSPDEPSADATFVHLRGGGHAMLRRAGTWNDLTADFVLGVSVPARVDARSGNRSRSRPRSRRGRTSTSG
ncbi:MAG TPA: alpha/beta fold hydrolase [Acidothermaceae bacterium]